MTVLTAVETQARLLAHHSGLRLLQAYGERTFFVNPDGRLPRGAYFATIKEADGLNDRTSRLDRDGRSGCRKIRFASSSARLQRVPPRVGR